MSILTLEELETRLGVTPDSWSGEEQAKYAAAIEAATTAIQLFAGRDFATDAITESRDFPYDGDGEVDISDATAITAVALVDGLSVYTLDSTLWTPQPTRPRNGIYESVIVPLGYRGFSPAMGFTRNLDRLAAEGRLGQSPALVRVTGTFGWPVVPEDVKQAAVWTIKSFTADPEPFQQKSIEGYSITIGDAPTDAIPLRAQALLTPYIRWSV